MDVATGRNQNKSHHCETRKNYYDWLSENIRIPGIVNIKRDFSFDEIKYRSGGIRLYYESLIPTLYDVKEGILLEVGFDDILPNEPKLISSWAYDWAVSKVEFLDNRAKDIRCYHPGYTFVEKLQTISTKFRKQQEGRNFEENFMRHYYDIYCLLQEPRILGFTKTTEYKTHKERRFRKLDNPDLEMNEAFLIRDKSLRQKYREQYNLSQSLYYKDKPDFDEILALIKKHISSL